VSDLAARVAELDAKLKPIADRPIDITEGDWMTKFRTLSDPLDEGDVRNDVEAVLTELTELYASGPDEERKRIRALVRSHRAFAWAAHFRNGPMTPESLRRDLLLFSIKDMGADPRDAIVELDDLCRTARKVGIDRSSVLLEVAEMSSDENHYGFGSTRSHLLKRSDVERYVAAGGVVIDGDRVLVLRRPSRDEVRLPKGHVDPGESVDDAAVREVREESGYAAVIEADLGEQIVELERKGRWCVRTERYFLMRLETRDVAAGEPQFEPAWLSWDEARQTLTFDAEREWLDRGRRVVVDGEDRRR
jgi:8-oxo-dGTP pyrophosphatase MutT (NUDIX family)